MIGKRQSKHCLSSDVGIGSKEHVVGFKDNISFLSSPSVVGLRTSNTATLSLVSSECGEFPVGMNASCIFLILLLKKSAKSSANSLQSE